VTEMARTWHKIISKDDIRNSKLMALAMVPEIAYSSAGSIIISSSDKEHSTGSYNKPQQKKQQLGSTKA